MDKDYIDEVEQFNNEDIDIYGDTDAERELHINQLFGFITRHAVRRLNLDESQEENNLLIYMAIDCLSKGIDTDVAIGHILAHMMGMGYFITESNIKETLAEVKEHCQKEILAYAIAIDDISESYADPAMVIIKVHKLLE